MKLERDSRTFVSNWIDFILNNAHITEEFEYDIVDEYDETTETMEMPVNYVILKDEQKVFIISINTDGLEQHRNHRQF
jgi:predicted NUDIX family phosphoesterase